MKMIWNEYCRLLRAAGYSWQGLRGAWQSEAAIRLEGLLLLLLTPVALLLPVSFPIKGLLIFSLLWVFVVELLNSAVEAIVDRIGPDHHELSGKAKDLGSAAVLVASIATALLWLFVLLSL